VTLHAQSRCSGTTAAGCTPTRACGRRANRCSAGKEYAGLSENGPPLTSAAILKHAKALCAICNSDDQQFTSGLVPGYEAPVNLALQRAEPFRAAIRIPTFSESPKSQAHRVSAARTRRPTHILAYTALLMAGLERGDQTNWTRANRWTRNIYELLRRKNWPRLPNVAG